MSRARSDTLRLARRVECPVARECGGCAWIGLPYREQLGRKTARVREALAALPETARIPVGACVASPAVAGYRNRAKLAVAEIDGRVAAGLHRKGSAAIVDLEPCRVQGARSLAALGAIKGWLERHALARPRGPVKHVDLREAADDALHLTLVVEREPEAGLPLEDLVAAVPALCGVSVNVNPKPSSYVFGARTRTPWGSRSFVAEVEGTGGERVGFEVPATGFFQVSGALLPWIHDQMARHLGEAGGLLDLYCGVGVHGLMVARRVAGPRADPGHVGVEEHVAAAACARRNADRLGVSADFRSGRVEQVLPALARERSFGRVILNPGRAGCRPAVLEALAPAPGRRMAYLSCEPGTLARDLAALVRAGWHVSRGVPLDLMPQTDQVETLALLTAAGSRTARVRPPGRPRGRGAPRPRRGSGRPACRDTRSRSRTA